MPYTSTGKSVLKGMGKTYKTEKKAKQVFHAMINKHAPGAEEWHCPLLGKKKRKCK